MEQTDQDATSSVGGGPRRILRPKTPAAGGYLETKPVFLLDFFQFETIDMNPPDAKGMVLGMSMPIPWKRV
ncbi:hypothetical protein [Bradyrhizobium sp.]